MEDKEFIRHISDVAKSFEAPYEEGAWEDFNRERYRKRGILGWRFAAAAAALVLVLLGGLWFKSESDKAQPVPKMAASPKIRHQVPAALPNSVIPQNKSSVVNPVDSANAIAIAPKNKQQAIGTGIKGNVAATANTPDFGVPSPVINPVKKDNAVNPSSAQNMAAVQHPDSSSTNLMASNQQKPVPAGNSVLRQNTVDKTPIYDKLVHHNTTKEPEAASPKNLNYALAVNPAVGNKKLNMGVGLEVAYAVNDHVSIGSGVGFASIHAQSGGNDDVVASRQLQGADLDVNGLEVPLNLSYKTGGGFYVNAGISAVAVVNNQMAYHYLTQTPQAVTLVNNMGASYQALRTTPTPTTEETKESLARYIGFYTFSVGKRQAIGKKQINWGPFLKVPFNPVSSQDIRLTQGGFRLSFEF